MFKQANYLGGKAMTDNAYFDLLREELNGIYEKYDNSYESLEQNVKANTANKKYFSGSSEMLCIYEPSLIKALRCSWSLKGSFKEKKPRSEQYHLISFDDEKAIKLDFFDDASTEYTEHKEIFFIYDQSQTIYLVFEPAKPDQQPMLREIYLLKYDDMQRLTEYVHIPSRALSKDLTGEIHKYKGHNLIESVRYSTWYSEFEKYEFGYSDNGYMNSYKSTAPNRNTVYTAKFTEKDIGRFEKYGRFYFSPKDSGKL